MLHIVYEWVKETGITSPIMFILLFLDVLPQLTHFFSVKKRVTGMSLNAYAADGKTGHCKMMRKH